MGYSINASGETIVWTKPMFERFSKKLDEELSSGRTNADIFVFERHEFLISYARYLREFLETKFGKIK